MYTPYTVEFRHAEMYSWFYTYVLYNGERIAEKAGCKNYVLAAWWALRRIRNHRGGLKILSKGV